MNQSTMRRTFGVLALVVLTQALSACVVVPLPAHRHRAVAMEPGYGYPPPPPQRGPYWRR